MSQLREWINLTAAMLLGEATEQGRYLYHGTSEARLPVIQREGLRPQMVSNYQDFGDGDDFASWSYGKVFFTTSLWSAAFYADVAAKNHDSKPVILRIRRSIVRDLQPDPRGQFGDESFSEEPFPPTELEYHSKARSPHWFPVTEYHSPSPRGKRHDDDQAPQ